MTHREFEGFTSYARRLKAAGDNPGWARLALYMMRCAKMTSLAKLWARASSWFRQAD